MRSRPYDAVKRAMDVVVSALVLLVTWPLLAIVALTIILDSPGGVFYRGQRVGRNGRLFNMLKFRTMKRAEGMPGPTSTSEDDPRITRVGRFLRRYKIDELPQFINVLVGDMSVVGPRPQVTWAVDAYTADERRILDVRPGVTDWASIQFRNEGEILKGHANPDEAYMRLIHPEKMRLALKYVEQRSLLVDLAIIVKTAAAAVRP